jgi:hypothetical protein
MDMELKSEGQTAVRIAGSLSTKSDTENWEGVHRKVFVKYLQKSVK